MGVGINLGSPMVHQFCPEPKNNADPRLRDVLGAAGEMVLGLVRMGSASLMGS
jgi:hypothetical protein